MEFRILNLRNHPAAFGRVCFPPAHGVNAVAFEPRQSPQLGAHGAAHIAAGVVRHGCIFQLFSNPGPEVAQEIHWGIILVQLRLRKVDFRIGAVGGHPQVGDEFLHVGIGAGVGVGRQCGDEPHPKFRHRHDWCGGGHRCAHLRRCAGGFRGRRRAGGVGGRGRRRRCRGLLQSQEP